jgi:hypothetical protein
MSFHPGRSGTSSELITPGSGSGSQPSSAMLTILGGLLAGGDGSSAARLASHSSTGVEIP